MFWSTILLITNSGQRFITNPPTPTVIYKFDSHHLLHQNGLLLEPCTTESTPTLKNHPNVNLILISPRKCWLSIISLLDLPILLLWVKPTSQLVLTAQLTFSGFTTLPNIKGVSVKIKLILLETVLQVVFKPFLTIGRFLPSVKDHINHNKKSNLVYEVSCQNCTVVNIGQTKRNFKCRTTECQQAIKFQRPEKSGLCQQSIENYHLINWSEFRILKFEHDYLKRLYWKLVHQWKALSAQ